MYGDPLGLAKENDPSSLDCCDLKRLIEENSRELKRKAWEEKNIQSQLLHGIISRTFIVALWQYSRHWREYSKIQDRLKDLLDEHNRRPCHPETPKFQAAWATNEFPDSEYILELYKNRMAANLKAIGEALSNPHPQGDGVPPPPWWQYVWE